MMSTEAPSDDGGRLVSQHERFQVRFVSGGGSDGRDMLRFLNQSGRWVFSVVFSNTEMEMSRLLALLRQGHGGRRVVEGAPVGFRRRMLLRLLGRSIEFADEFSAQVKRSEGLQSELVVSTRFVFAQLRGWFTPRAVILITNVSRTIPTGRWGPSKRCTGNFRKWRLTLDDCRRLADGIERMLPLD